MKACLPSNQCTVPENTKLLQEECVSCWSKYKALPNSIPPVKKTVKNIVLVLYMPKLMDWRSWQIKSPTPPAVLLVPIWCVQMNKEKKRKKWSMNYLIHTIPLSILQNFTRMNKLLTIYGHFYSVFELLK